MMANEHVANTNVEKRKQDVGNDAVAQNGEAKKLKQDAEERHTIPAEFLKTLVHARIEEVVRRDDDSPVFYVERQDKVTSVFKSLCQKHFLSAPVLEKREHHWYSFIDMFDIVSFYIEMLGTKVETMEDFWEHVAASEELNEKEVKDIVRHSASRSSTTSTTKIGYSLFSVMEQLALEDHLHRLPIIDERLNLVNIVTQTDMIKYLRKHIDELGRIQAQPLADFQEFIRPVISVEETDKAIDAFLLMRGARVSGVAIQTVEGRLSGNLSLRDLYAIESDGKLFHRLFQTVSNYKRHLHHDQPANDRPQRIIFLQTKDTLAKAIHMLDEHNLHHLFIVDDDHKPVGVVSCKDILSVVVRR